MVFERFRNQLRSDEALGCQTRSLLEVAGDLVRFVDDRDLRVCVDYPSQERGARPRAPHDEHVRVHRSQPFGSRFPEAEASRVKDSRIRAARASFSSGGGGQARG